MGTILIGGVRFRLDELDSGLGTGPNHNNACWVPGNDDGDIYLHVVMFCNLQLDLFNTDKE